MDRAFDARRRVVTEQHPGGGITTHRYVGEALVATILPEGSRLPYGYDARLRLLWFEHAAGERHVFQRDAAGRSWHVARRRGPRGAMEQIGVHGYDRAIEEAIEMAARDGGELVARLRERSTGIGVTRDVRGRGTRIRVWRRAARYGASG
ncbi:MULTISPECIES: hypothetical protein [Sorangium]|uniref:Uncharacterized protein n=1 Tax=Sorangium cellulosum (strain So ce56) TaxID=448385 RepID=A9F6I9_SORC5|nr:hypothetical protein [Sorangium cellulosum]CAN91439.1 hypothetical protein sce1281 [Sorangium cellulosum So ce56]